MLLKHINYIHFYNIFTFILSSDNVIEPPPLPAEFWKIFYESVPVLFNNDEDIVQKLGIIIEKCKDHYEYYVPPNVGQNEKYEANISHYIGSYVICMN